MLTKEAFNALLKTLEEPPSFVTFILATTEPQKVPATVMSRCEKFEFKLGSNKDIEQALVSIVTAEKVEVEKAGISLLITHAGGSYRDAVSLLDTLIATSGVDKVLTEEEVRNALGLPDFELVEKYIKALATNSTKDAFGALEDVFTRGTNILQFNKAIILMLRDLMLGKVKSSEIGNSLTRAKYIESIKALLEAYTAQKNAFDQRLPLQMATMQLITDGAVQQEGKKEVLSQPPQAEVIVEQVKVIDTVKVDEVVIIEVEKPAEKVEVKAIVKKRLMKKKKKKVEGKPIQFDEVERLWGQFAREVQKENKQLYTFIMPARPSGAHFDSQLKVPKVEIKVPFEFHRKQLENPKNQMTLSALAVKVFGTPMQFICIISKEELVFKKPVTSSVDSNNFASPAVEAVKIDATSIETALETAFESVLGADVESL
jgi:DNA polymerase-3 subunit gamma/tau